LALGVLLAVGNGAVAQDVGGSAAFKNGAASYSAGKYDNAVRQLTAAVNADSVAAGEAAKGLYLRGMAYRKLNQPSRAIADLGAAIWLGLPASDQVTAQVNRALAYRAAGLSAEADAEVALARKSGSSKEVDALLAEGGGTAEASIAAFSTEVHVENQTSAPTPTRTADASSQWTPSVANTAEPRATQEKPLAPTAAGSWDTAVSATDAAPEKPASSGNRLTRWFSSVTSKDQSAPPPSESSAPPAAPSEGWTAQTQARNEEASPPPQPRTAEATPAAAPPAAPSGYRLQLTASRSEEEAKQLWQQVLGQHKELAGREPLIEKTDLGNLGTFYRLQIGPFPDKAESLKLCNTLKQSGVDCFLVAR
jgi:tetratricopeptide (TPR) repeat protein